MDHQTLVNNQNIFREPILIKRLCSVLILYAIRSCTKKFPIVDIRNLTLVEQDLGLVWECACLMLDSHLSHDVWGLYTKFAGDQSSGIFLLNMFTAYSLLLKIAMSWNGKMTCRHFFYNRISDSRHLLFFTEQHRIWKVGLGIIEFYRL